MSIQKIAKKSDLAYKGKVLPMEHDINEEKWMFYYYLDNNGILN